MKTNITLKTTAVATVLLGMSSIAGAVDTPPPVPDIYAKGPAEPRLNVTDMREAEKVAFALNEAMLQATEALIYVKGCQEFSVPIEVYSYPYSKTHFIKNTSYNGIALSAQLRDPIAGFGQLVAVAQPTQGVLNGTKVQGLRGTYTYDYVNNMMVNERTGVLVQGQNRSFDQYYSSVIKDFYFGSTYDSAGDPNVILDYGLQSVSKFGFPVNKWWQKSKNVRDDGQQGCTVFQKDRLVGTGTCRIVLSTTGLSQPDLFWQTGTLKVSKTLPNVNETELNGCQVNPIFNAQGG